MPVSRMLIPQYSIRWLFAITALCAVVFSVVALGVQNQRWAIGVTVALAALVILMLVHAALFGLVWLFASLTGRGRGKNEKSAGSPFASPAPAGSARSSEPEQPATPILLE